MQSSRQVSSRRRISKKMCGESTRDFILPNLRGISLDLFAFAFPLPRNHEDPVGVFGVGGGKSKLLRYSVS